MFRKKSSLTAYQDLQRQIQNLQDQINGLRLINNLTVEVVDSSGKTVMISDGYGFYNHKPYPKMQCVTLKQVVEAIVEQLGVKIEVLEQSPSKVVVRGK